MMCFTRLHFPLALCGLVVVAAVTPAAAQEQGRMVGTVTDAQAAVLPGVAVTAASPSLIGTQTVITEGDGKYRFPALASGRYTLTFELAGFQTTKRENLLITLGQTTTLDMQLHVASLQESVTVSGESPVVDLQSTKVGSEFNAEKLAGIPSATDLWATLSQAPGVRMLGFDVGGSHKSQQVGYESFGVRNQNRVVTDGVDTTEGTSGTGFYQDFFAHEEITVSAMGGDVTMNTPGSAVFSTIKSGGNAFKTLNNLTYEGKNFVGNNIDADTSKRGFTGQPNLLFYEGHTDLGGPVKRDKVWFYTSYNHFKIDKVISGVDQAIATDIGIFDTYVAKGTYKASQKDTIAAYYQWGRKQKPFRGLSTTVGPESILAQDSKSWMYNGQYQRVWTNRLFSDLKVGLFGFGWPMVPSVDFKTKPPRVDTSTSVESGAGWLSGLTDGGPFSSERNKPQIFFTTTYFLPEKAGSHDFKAGFEWLDDQSRFGGNGNSGPILYNDKGGALDEIRITDSGTFETYGKDWTGPDDRDTRLALFFQDRWSVSNRLTLSLGVRYDHQRAHYQDSIRKPVLTLFPALTTTGATLLTSDKVMPRLGVSYDPVGNGKSVIKGFYGRYYFNFADRLSNVNPGGTNGADYKFNDLNGNRLYDGPQELGTVVRRFGGTSTTLDPNLKTPYTDEVSASFERQFWGESSARVAYVRKMTRDEFATINMAREGQFTVPRAVTLNLQSFDGGISGPRTFTVFDIPDSLRGVTRNVVTNIPGSVGGGNYTFDTIQLAFNKRFGRGLFLQSSFDYQWRDELRQNAASNSPLNSDPLGVAYFQNVNPDVSNRQKSTNWQGRLLGRYVFPYEIGFGANLRVQSGWAYSRLMRASLPNAGTQTFFLENIENNRSDTNALFDLRVDKAFKINKYKFVVLGDLYNLLNSNSVSNFNLLNGSRYNNINATLDPRTAQVALRFEF